MLCVQYIEDSIGQCGPTLLLFQLSCHICTRMFCCLYVLFVVDIVVLVCVCVRGCVCGRACVCVRVFVNVYVAGAGKAC